MYCIKILSVTHIEIIVLFGYQKLRDRHSQPLGCGPHYWILEWKRRGIVDDNILIGDLEIIAFLRRQQCQLSMIQRQSCTTFCHCDCEEWVACFLEFFSAGYGSHSGALCHQTSHSEVKYCLQNFSDIMSSNVSKVDRVFCLIHTSY